MDYDIDNVDERIIYYLEKDARNSHAPEIADELGLSPSTIRKRIDKLEEHGIIKGYHAETDYEKCGQRLTQILVCTATISDRERLAKQASNIPGIINVQEIMSGKRNVRVKAVGKNIDEINRIAQKLTNVGLEVEEENLIKDEYFIPFSKFGPEEERKHHPQLFELKEGENLTEMVVKEDLPISGLTLEEANQKGLIPEDVLVVAIKRNGDIITPKGKTEIVEGDRLKVFSSKSQNVHELPAFREQSQKQIQ